MSQQENSDRRNSYISNLMVKDGIRMLRATIVKEARDRDGRIRLHKDDEGDRVVVMAIYRAMEAARLTEDEEDKTPEPAETPDDLQGCYNAFEVEAAVLKTLEAYNCYAESMREFGILDRDIELFVKRIDRYLCGENPAASWPDT